MTTTTADASSPGADASSPGADASSPGADASSPGGAGSERKAPGRPRSARAEQAIIDAVLALLAEGQSADAISVESVATRAGVGKATIYRRWPNKEALLIDALRTLKGPVPVPAGESLRDDLIMLVSVIGAPRQHDYRGITACLLPEFFKGSELGAVYQAVIEPRRDVMREVLRRGIASGDLRADLDVELSLLMLSGSSLLQNMLRWNQHIPEDGFAANLVDAFLAGAQG